MTASHPLPYGAVTPPQRCRTIAVAGKGGVGKTTLAGLVVTRLVAHGATPVLAIDADPNRCLDGVLGVRVEETVGRIREEARELAQQGLGAGVSKQQLLELKIAQCLVEADGFDLIAMGRCEGAGCYCYANNVLKQVIGRLADDYPHLVIDNEAGLENLSRRLVHQVDLLLLVGDASARGLETIRRLHALAREMGVVWGRLAIAVNRVRPQRTPPGLDALRAATAADDILLLGEDDAVADLAEAGTPLHALPADNPLVATVDALLARGGAITTRHAS